MKKYNITFTLLIFVIFLSGCNKISKNKTQWGAIINGDEYNWTEKEGVGSGGSTFTKDFDEKINLYDFNPDESIEYIMIAIDLPSLNIGTYYLNNDSWNLGHFFSANYPFLGGFSYSTGLYGNVTMTVKITESNPDRIKGTFSGSISRENQSGQIQIINVTDGYFTSVLE